MPIRIPQSQAEGRHADRLSELARELTDTKGRLRQLEADFAAFPEPLLPKLGPVDVYRFETVIQGEPQAQNIRVDDVTFQKKLDGQWTMSWGRTTFHLPGEAHMRLARRWLEIQGVMNVATDDFLAVHVPAEPDAAARLLQLLEEQEAEIERLQDALAAGEAEVNQLVAALYGLDDDDMAVINDFLERF